MKKIFYRAAYISFFVLLMAVGNKNSVAQTAAKIENTRLEIDEGRLIITYDLLYTRNNERFNVWVNISKPSGQEIGPKNITGHIGKNIAGGKGLIIVWNYDIDGIDYEGEVDVQVMAELIETSSLKIEKVLLKSAVLPGWGIYDIDKKSTYFLLGAAGYGSIAAALVYNGKSDNTYTDYLNSEDIDKRESLYNDYTRQINASRVFGIAAAAIWIADFGWATIKYLNKVNTVASVPARINIHIGYDYYAFGNTPMLSLKYMF
jgi:hypothetical protein